MHVKILQNKKRRNKMQKRGFQQPSILLQNNDVDSVAF